jgi:putative ABC transport system permease protein
MERIKPLKLVCRSLLHYRRTNLGVALGTMVGTAVLVGALVTGDSARGSLKRIVYERLGRIEFALHTDERYFRSRLADDISDRLNVQAAPVMLLRGIASNGEKELRVNGVQVLGVDRRFWRFGLEPAPVGDIEANEAVLNRTLAARIAVERGDEFLLRVPKAQLMPADAPLSDTTVSTATLRLKVRAVVSDSQMGRFSLRANQVSPATVFVSLSQLAEEVEQPDSANSILLAGGTGIKPTIDRINGSLREVWTIRDAGVELDTLGERNIVELRSKRIFIESVVEEAAFQASEHARGILTYFVNGIASESGSTPYSFVSAPGSPVVPDTMASDEVILNRWLAHDLDAAPGDPISLSYLVPVSGGRLEERNTTFTVHSVIANSRSAALRALMPPFHGLAEVDNCRDWNPGIPIDLDRIRPKDQEYWDRFRGTPKAFVTLGAAQQMWMNRFGRLTAIRFTDSPHTEAELAGRIMDRLDPAALGLLFEPVLQQGLEAGRGAVDFGQLFLGLSIFLIIAALLLTGLLFALNIEQRAEDTATLLSLGIPAFKVRALLMTEGLCLALIGCTAGTALGVFYNRAVLYGLNTVWQGAVGTATLSPFLSGYTLLLGFLTSMVLVTLVLWAATKRQFRKPLAHLRVSPAFSRPAGMRRNQTIRLVPAITCLVGVAVVLGVSGNGEAQYDPGRFFTAGFLMLLGNTLILNALMTRSRRHPETGRIGLGGLALNSFALNRWRNLAAAGILSCGIFIVIAVGSNRPSSFVDARARESGTGGFTLYGETTLPLLHDLNTEQGRRQHRLELEDPESISFAQLRLYDGDDASCLNLNRVENPSILGVRPDIFAGRNSFSFVKTIDRGHRENPWLLLERPIDDDTIPAIADQSVITWGLRKSLGDSIEYVGEGGESIRLKLVAGLENSIFQGNILVSEQALLEHFPSIGGSRIVLVDCPLERTEEIADTMRRVFRNSGIVLNTTTERLGSFDRVTNTYLSIFLLLGGLGLVIGSLGLGIVVYRNVLSRRQELGILRAVGYDRRSVHWLIFLEHALVLVVGIVSGALAAFIAAVPHFLSSVSTFPTGPIAAILALIAVNGGIWIFLATLLATKGNLMAALRNE